MKWAGHLPEEGVLELALEGGTGFTESMKVRWSLCVSGGRAGWEEVSGANFLLFHPLLGVSSESLLLLGLLSSAPASSLGRSKETQPAHPVLSQCPLRFRNSPSLFPPTISQHLLSARQQG